MMLSTIKNSFITIDTEDVITTARHHQLDVQTIQDFRKQRYHYERIEDLMDEYKSSFAKKCALGGLTTGIGGLVSAITFAGFNTITLSISLYRLAQRYAILNGFDESDPLQRSKMMNIYFSVLSINGVGEAILKKTFLKATAASDAGDASESLILRLIIRSANLIGKNISAEEAGSFIPVVGGLAGASLNYSFAKKSADAMKEAYKKAYFNTWQGEDI